MPDGKSPRPLCRETNYTPIDDGTMCLAASETPTPVKVAQSIPFDLSLNSSPVLYSIHTAGLGDQCTAGISTNESLLHIDLRPLLAQGVRFVFRYYKPKASHPFALSEPEAEYLSAHGLMIGVVYEGEPKEENRKATYFSLSDPSTAYQKGQEHAKNACRSARALGQPAGSAIYFAVDFDAVTDPTEDTEKNHAFRQYFKGIGDYLTGYSYSTGAYGSGALCTLLLREPKLVTYTWLAMSSGWTGSKTFEAWDVKQSGPHGNLGSLGIHYEWCEADGNFGGFALTACTLSPRHT